MAVHLIDEQPREDEGYRQTYAGLPVVSVPAATGGRPAATSAGGRPALTPAGEGPAQTPAGGWPPEPGAVAWRLSASDWDVEQPDSIAESFGWLFDNVETEKVQALVIGEWEDLGLDSGLVIEQLVEHAGRLPALRALFLGAIAAEECERLQAEAGESRYVAVSE
ncbi:hypothetical protein [Nonomuraea candida]|uniref:hypothetical protein n=1 Tax=Nonomuraea candida TaxID=359159 RepID=UPI0005BDBF4F|nr:hypothetical protein [Nonomuraea candida]